MDLVFVSGGMMRDKATDLVLFWEVIGRIMDLTMPEPALATEKCSHTIV